MPEARTEIGAESGTETGAESGTAIRAVWCDFGGVLTSSIAGTFDRVARESGVPADTLLAAVRRVAAPYGTGLIEPLELGLLSQREWGRRVTAELAPDWTPRIDLGRFGDYWYAGRTVNTALFELLARLRARGVRVGMLTNSVREWEPHRRAISPDVPAFELTINSYEVGLRKPDPAIFRLAEERFGTAPRACLLIDDLAANCAAAARRGWRTIEHRALPDTLARLGASVPG